MIEFAPIRTRPAEPGPKHTLGDQVIEWAMTNLVHAVTGEPWVPLPEHERFINTWYEVDENGDWTYSKGYVRRARGTAKSPLAAVLSAVELCGPCRFGGWDENGYPIAVVEPAPVVWIMATSVEQAGAIFEILQGTFSDALIKEQGLTISKEQVIKSGAPRGKIKIVPNNPRALRGPRPTFVAVDETSELVASNSGHESILRIDGNLDKNPGGRARRLDLSNAYVPGEDSVAERQTMNWTKQTQAWGYSHILFDCLEADPRLDLSKDDELRIAIVQAAGDATWLPVERLMRSAKEPERSVAVFRREHLNQVTAEEDSVVQAHVYDRQAQDVEPLEAGDRVTLGFDGSLSGDGTALVALRLRDSSIHLLHYQEPDPLEPDWRVDEQAVDDAFRLAMDRYDVWAAGCDLHPFESWIMRWNADFGDKMKVAASTTGPLIRDNRSARRDLTLGFESLLGEIESEKIWFGPDKIMRAHWLQAKKAENTYGISFRKVTPNSVRRVDIVAAGLMAYLMKAKIDAANIQEPKPRRGVAYAW